MSMPDWQRKKLLKYTTNPEDCIVPRGASSISTQTVLVRGGKALLTLGSTQINLRHLHWAAAHDLDVCLHTFHLHPKPTCGSPECVNPDHQRETAPAVDLVADGMVDLHNWLKTGRIRPLDFNDYRRCREHRTSLEFCKYLLKTAFNNGDLDPYIHETIKKHPRPEHHRMLIKERFGLSEATLSTRFPFSQ